MSFQKPLVNIGLVSFITSEKKTLPRKGQGFFFLCGWALLLNEVSTFMTPEKGLCTVSYYQTLNCESLEHTDRGIDYLKKVQK